MTTYDAGSPEQALYSLWKARILRSDARKLGSRVTGDPHDKRQCTHLDQIHVRHTNKRGCEECLKMGDTWVHLSYACCAGMWGVGDSSKNKHATKHYHATKHPLMRSISRASRGVVL